MRMRDILFDFWPYGSGKATFLRQLSEGSPLRHSLVCPSAAASGLRLKQMKYSRFGIPLDQKPSVN
jgi:hypothetical protein